MWYRAVISSLACVLVVGCVHGKHVPNKKLYEEKEVYSNASYTSTDRKVYFDFDKPRAENIKVFKNNQSFRDEDKSIIAEAVKQMQEDPSVNVMLEGHTDSCGSDEYNLALGERRAASVKEFMIHCDKSLESRIQVSSMGKRHPEVIDNKSVSDKCDRSDKKGEEARAKNRRVVISFSNDESQNN